jgi:hypothetical protein
MYDYVVINPNTKTMQKIKAKDMQEAIVSAGLKSGEVDWGSLGRTSDQRSIGVMAYEFGLRPEMQKESMKLKYVRIGRQLYAGNLLVFASDLRGDEANMTDGDMEALGRHVEYYENEDECEEAFTQGKMDRPTIAVNGEVIWRWNQKDE